MILGHKLYRGTVMHERLAPKKHRFVYPFTFFQFEPSSLKSLSERYSYFGYNQRRMLEIRDSDYLRGKEIPLLKQLEEFLGEEQSGERTLLITSPRYFGAAFNPVNFFFRLNDTHTVLKALVEVNNTFGDRHLYLVDKFCQESPGIYTGQSPKAFHVSPFNRIEGVYTFRFEFKNNGIFLGIDLFKNEECVMKTYLSGTVKELNTKNLFQYSLLHPLDTALNAFPRILTQAAVLFFKKRLAIFKRPEPQSKNTIINDCIQKDPNSKI